MTPQDVYNNLVNKKYAVPDDVWKAAFPGRGIGTPITRKRYYEEETRLKEVLKADLEDAFGLTAYPTRDAIFEKAWNDAHERGGLHSTYLQYAELAALIVT